MAAGILKEILLASVFGVRDVGNGEGGGERERYCKMANSAGCLIRWDVRGRF